MTRIVGRTGRSPARQKGAALAIALILSIVLAFSAISFIKMVDSSTLLARNASFQRDALNRNDLMINNVLREFENNGGAHFAELANTDTTAAGLAGGVPYSAVALQDDPQGIPLVLKDEAAFGRDYGGLPQADLDVGEAMNTRVVVDRLCGLEQPVDDSHCSVATVRVKDFCSRCARVSTPLVPVFRVSAATAGPRRTESYSQALISIPIE
jgi:hypothetical protein